MLRWQTVSRTFKKGLSLAIALSLLIMSGCTGPADAGENPATSAAAVDEESNLSMRPVDAATGQVNFAIRDGLGVWNSSKNELTIFAVNRAENEEIQLEISFDRFVAADFIEHWEMAGYDRKSVNTMENPDAVIPTFTGVTTCSGLKAVSRLKPLSWNVIRFTVQ